MVSVQKMVICDCDGTLLPAGETRLSPEVIDVIRRLPAKGVLFAVASGRPYEQLRELFAPVAQQVIFACMDGSLLMHRDCVLGKRPIPDRLVREALARYPDVLLFGRRKLAAFGNPKFAGTPCGSLFAFGEPVLRMGISTADRDPLPELRCIYREDGWAELIAPCANKGAALADLCRKFGIQPENVYAFGDSDNDIELLQAAGHPYKMTASRGLERVYIPTTASVTATLREEFGLPEY